MTEYSSLASPAKAIKYYCQNNGPGTRESFISQTLRSNHGGDMEAGPGEVGRAGLEVETPSWRRMLNGKTL